MQVSIAEKQIEAFISAAEDGGEDRWEVFSRHLYRPFRHVWEPWFITFGWCKPGSEQARAMVDSLNLQQCAEQLRRFRQDGAAGIICDTLGEAESFCPSGDNAGAFVLLGLGRTDGCVVFTGEGPALFLGVDTYPGGDHLPDLVAHEYNHVVRLSCREVAPGQVDEDAGLFAGLTVGDLTVMEGLAVAFPLCLRGEKVTRYAVSEAGFMDEGAVELCLESEQQIRREIHNVWGEPLSENLMLRFFASGSLTEGQEGEMPAKAGYFMGARLVQRLLDRGWDIGELTTAPTERFRPRGG